MPSTTLLLKLARVLHQADTAEYVTHFLAETSIFHD